MSLTKRLFVVSFVMTCLLLFFSLPLSSETLRCALVIGNAAYDDDARLKNPANDAADVAAALERIGWKVTLVIDADRRSMNRSIVSFRDTLAAAEGTHALFYYAGHGMQVDGENYLIPVKSDFETVDDVKADAVSVQTLAEAVERAKAGVSLFILDACRDNPFAKKMTRSLGGSRGLTVVQNAGGSKGSAIMFSTSPGDVAMDGTGRNGVFTAALLKHIESDLKVEELFKRVTGEVREASSGAQKPWINASLSSDFYFVSDEIRIERTAAAARIADETRRAELAKVAEMARAEEAAKAEKARAEAESARATAAEALAAKARLEDEARLNAEKAAAAEAARQAELAKPKGKARIESGRAGAAYADTEYLGEVGPDQPLVVDSLAVGAVELSIHFAVGGTESRSVTVTDKAYTTVLFGRPAIQSVAAAPGIDPATPVALWLRKAAGQDEAIVAVFSKVGAVLDIGTSFTDTDLFPANLEPGVYIVKARLAEDSDFTYEATYEAVAGGNLVVELPELTLSSAFLLNKELGELALRRIELETSLRSSVREKKVAKTIGWISFGIGIATFAASSYFLVDGLVAMDAYRSANKATEAVDARRRGQLASFALCVVPPVSVGTLLLSWPFLKDNKKIEKRTAELQELDARISVIGGSK